MSDSPREIDSSVIVKIADNPEKFIGAAVLAHFVRNTREAMFLVKMLGAQVSNVPATLARIFKALNLGTVADALSAGGHSTELQTWLEEEGLVVPVGDEVIDDTGDGDEEFEYDADLDTLLILVNNALVKLPDSVVKLGEGLFLDVLSKQATGQAHYVLDHFMEVSKFGTYGTVKTALEYEQDTTAVVILDCSGSMGRPLGLAIAEPIVRLANELKCDLILVSTEAVKFPAGTFTADKVLDNWQNGWTFYNQLIAHLNDITKSYDIAITVADYDSHAEHKRQIARECAARFKVVYDVNVQYLEDEDGNIKSSYLGECMGQLLEPGGQFVPVFVGAPGLDYSGRRSQ